LCSRRWYVRRLVFVPRIEGRGSSKDHPKLWNSTAIIATLSGADASGTADEEKLTYRFTVENRTDRDYSLPGNDSLEFMVRGGQNKVLLGANELFVDDRIHGRFFPARQNVAVHLTIKSPSSKTYGARSQPKG
jgi:hypothetical protein